MILGEVTTFPYVEADKAQALKPLEEAAEVYAAWQEYDEATTLGDYRTLRLLGEIADCITACCNLAAAIGCDDIRPFLQMAEFRNEQRGRYE